MTRKVFKKVAKYIKDKGTIQSIQYYSPNSIYNVSEGRVTSSKVDGEYLVLEYYNYIFSPLYHHKKVNCKIKTHRKYIEDITLYDKNMKYITRREQH